MRKSTITVFASYTEKICKWLEWLAIVICILCGGLLFSVTILGVLFRYVLMAPLRWSEELARMLLIWIVFFGGSIATREGKHLKLDYFENIFPQMLKRIIELISIILSLIFLAILLYTSYLMMNEIGKVARLSVIRVSMGYPYFALPAGAFLMIFQLINNLLQKFSKRSAGNIP